MTYGSYMWECGLQMKKRIEKEDEDLDKVEVKDLWLSWGWIWGRGGLGLVTSCCVPAQLFQTVALRDFSPGLQCSAQDWSEPETENT